MEDGGEEDLVDFLFDIRQSDLKDTNINNNLTCIQQGLDVVCCKKNSTPPRTTSTTTNVLPQKPPKCGQYNPDGLEIKAKNPSDDGNEAFER